MTKRASGPGGAEKHTGGKGGSQRGPAGGRVAPKRGLGECGRGKAGAASAGVRAGTNASRWRAYGIIDVRNLSNGARARLPCTARAMSALLRSRTPPRRRQRWPQRRPPPR